MAFQGSNQFWRNRSNHGRDKLFESPELLWQAASDYFNWCDAHPWYKIEAIKSGEQVGELIKIPQPIPYKIEGLCLFLGASSAYWRNFRRNPNLSDDFLTVVDRIEQVIVNQKFTGAAVGAFNANIIARDLGMVDKTELSGPNGEPLSGALLNITLPPGMNISFPSNTNDDSNEE